MKLNTHSVSKHHKPIPHGWVRAYCLYVSGFRRWRNVDVLRYSLHRGSETNERYSWWWYEVPEAVAKYPIILVKRYDVKYKDYTHWLIEGYELLQQWMAKKCDVNHENND